MIRLEEIIKILEEKYPKSMKEEWDNVGLMIGNKNMQIEKILVALDLTKDVLEEAITNDVDLVITHHPFIMSGIKNVTCDTTLGQEIYELIKNNISVYSMHTNLDKADDGMNDYLAKMLELENVTKLDEKLDNAYIRIGNLKCELTITELAQLIKDKLDIKNVAIITNDSERRINKISLCTGSGKSFLMLNKKLKSDCYITGDINYHSALDAQAEDINVIDAGHFGTEKIVVKLIKEFLQDKIDAEIIESKNMKNPIKIY